ncbi:chaperonin 10-like protein [Xylariales sp. AK1849]|nr:chaperonin 10-like protein [Xylariales sp. AK1849]
MDALLLEAEKRTAFVRRISRPIPGPGEVLVKVDAIALNPVDSLYVFNPLATTRRTVGSDWAGTVEESHSDELQPGKRVAGFLQGACSVNDRPGAFAEYLVCPADLLWIVPESMSFEEASAVSLCALTAAQAIFYRLGFKAPFDWTSDTEVGSKGDVSSESFSFFIYGATTSVGMYAAQLVRRAADANRSNVKLIGAASKARFSMLLAEPYRYDALVDYRDADWPEQVKNHTGVAGVDFVYDCISEGQTVKLASSALRRGGGMAIVRSKEGGAFDESELLVEPIYGAVWESFGVEVHYQGLVVPVSCQARAFAVAFYKWLSEGHKLAANPLRLMPGGLGKIVSDGFSLLGSGSMGDRQQNRIEPWMKPISAEKLVYKVDNS